MIRPGLLLWIFKDETIFYIRLLHLFGIGFEKINNEVGIGFKILLGIFSFEFGIHLIKRRGGYVERIKNEKSPQALA
jgi:UPF0716 family protein affecting phage T7 exclusion